MDELLILNFITDYLALSAAAILSGEIIRRRRIALAALIGAAYAAITVICRMSVLVRLPFQLLVAALMILTAYGIRAHLLRLVLCFCGVSALFCGAVTAFGLVLGRQQTGALLSVDLRLLSISVLLCYGVISMGFRKLLRDAKERKLISIKVCFAGRECHLRGLYDSGNKLRDPISGRGVVVTTFEKLRHIFPHDLCALLSAADLSQSSQALILLSGSPHSTRFGLIPYSSVGTSKGMMLTFRPDAIEVDGTMEQGRAVAFSPTAISPGNDFDAIINL